MAENPPQSESDPPSDETAQPWSVSSKQVLEHHDVKKDQGLDSSQTKQRLEQYGRNELQAHKPPGAWRILLQQFTSMVVLLLVAAMILAGIFAQWPEMIAVAAVILVNTGLGFTIEWRARHSMQALRQQEKQYANVRRDGNEQSVEVTNLVPGDIVIFEAEQLVPADARILDASHLRVNEAALTGESVPVTKQIEPIEPDATLAERTSMLFRGTTLVEGRAEAVVTATGMQTQIGHVSEMAQQAHSVSTPLHHQLNRLGRRLAIAVIFVAGGLAALGYFVREQQTMLLVETSIALGIAAIPEGLPIVATMALARGMYLMAKHNALINRLPAVETIGATRVVFTDKTGTLTQNRMTLRRLVQPDDDHELNPDENSLESRYHDNALFQRAVDIGVLCNNAELSDDETDGDQHDKGDPMEVALLKAGRACGITRQQRLEQMPERREVSFDPDEMKMATFHESNGRYLVAVKGAAARVLEVCTTQADPEAGDCEASQPLDDQSRQQWSDKADDLASAGLRVLALADRWVVDEQAEPYEQLRLVALIGLLDPPRENVRATIDTMQQAGVKLVMVTGDQPQTAETIAESVGIVGDVDDPEAVVMHGKDLKDPQQMPEDELERVHDTNIFARVSPEQKLDLIAAYQRAGETVAMTGDGVNDAPALKKADIGVAMGQRGTDAAKQVSDMILTDDALPSIVHAIERGRIVFANIRKATFFMLCTNIAEVLAVAVAFAANWPVPLRPLQILYLNVLTDVLPALALSVGAAAPGVMRLPPRPPDESVLTRRHWLGMSAASMIIATCVIGALMVGLHVLELSTMQAVTMSFLTLGFAKLWFTFTLREPRSHFWNNEITRNPWVWAAIGSCILLLLAAVHVPGLNSLLQTRVLTLQAWAVILTASLLPSIIGQIGLWIYRRQTA